LIDPTAFENVLLDGGLNEAARSPWIQLLVLNLSRTRKTSMIPFFSDTNLEIVPLPLESYIQLKLMGRNSYSGDSKTLNLI
jgi:hypothetical protein